MAATTTTPEQPPQAAGERPTWLRAALPRQATTPQLIALAMVIMVVAAVAWGAVGTWTVTQHASAASDVVHVSEPLSLDARELYLSLSDADVTATTAFLSGPHVPLPVRQRYQDDIRQAGRDLSALTAAAAPGDGQLAASLQAVATNLPVYASDVAQAQTDYALGYQLAGGSFMQVASEQMHLRLLPAAQTIDSLENAGLAVRSGQATGLPWIIVMLLLSLFLAAGLLRLQRWLSRRTRRTFNVGLLAASIALTITGIWLLISFTVARSDLQSAEAHGSVPVQALARATITIQRARGDEVLNLISRSGNTSFQGDFEAARHQVGPGAGTLLATAAADSRGSNAATPIAAAGRDGRTWYTASARVFQLDIAANYAAETGLVIGTGPGGTAAGFSRLESDLTSAIAADQAVFATGASAGAGAFGGLDVAVVIAAVVMAVGSAWGLARRLGEYR
jgi:hypothetical protein